MPDEYTGRDDYYNPDADRWEWSPDPLSEDVRCILTSIWRLYDFVDRSEFDLVTVQLYGLADAARKEKIELALFASVISHDLFIPTSDIHPTHIHSRYGCDEGSCDIFCAGIDYPND